MIRILHVVTDMRRGGLETMLMNYYRSISRDKVQFDFLTHRDYKGDYDDEIESYGGIIYHISKLNPFNNEYINELTAFFLTHPEYRIIHVHQDCMSSVILKTAKKCGISVRIAHSHSSNQNKDMKYPIKLFYKQFIPKYATDLMACSEEAGKWMFGKNTSFIVLNNAIDAKKYTYDLQKAASIRKTFEFEKDELVLGHVGRFSYPKNHSFIIDVFHSISKHRKAKLLLVGEGTLRKEIEAKVNQLDLQDNVIFTGVRSDVPDLMQAMDIFVFPSNYEGLPVTLVEAQSAGLPCFISDKVPIECKKTDFVEQIPLSSGADFWAEKILSCRKERRDTFQEICKSGYDIHENAKWLEEYYLEKSR